MATLANGTKFHKLNEGGTAYATTYTDVTTGGELGGERGDIDITTLDSGSKEYIPGMSDAGELALEMLATVSNYSSLETDYNARTVSTYAVTFPLGTVGANMDKKFTGYLKSCKITGIEPDGVLKIAATVKVSGCLKAFTRFIESLTVTSVAGATTGTTKVSVTPEIECGNVYKYKTAAIVTLPTYGDALADYTAWDGVSDITAVTGNEIVIAESFNGTCVKAGKATVASKA